MKINISEAQSDKQILNCFPVMVQLRPHLVEKDFVVTLRKQFEQGYKLVYLEDNTLVCAVAGFRLFNSLSAGRHLFLDDLVCDSDKRSKGYGSMLFDWLVDYAKLNGCNKLRLDSGVQRYGAHRFYLKKGMDITCHHFDLVL